MSIIDFIKNLTTSKPNNLSTETTMSTSELNTLVEKFAAAMGNVMKENNKHLTESIVNALATVGADDDADKSGKPAVRRGGFRGGKKSTFENTIDLIHVREYSKNCYVVYGDTKDREDRIDAIAQFIPEDKAVTPRMITLIEGSPWGYFVPTASLNECGGVDALVNALTATGAAVEILDSLAAESAARRKERKKAPSNSPVRGESEDAAPETPKGSVPTDEAEPIEAEEVTEEPIEEEQPIEAETAVEVAEEPAPAPAAPVAAAPKPAVPIAAVAPAIMKREVAQCVGAMCYDNDADAADGYVAQQRDLISIDKVFARQEEKGYYIYAMIGNDVENNERIYVNVGKQRGQFCEIADEQLEFLAAICENPHNAVMAGTCKPSDALVWAYVRLGEQQPINDIYGKLYGAAA